ncbi:hypothetical protein Cgig2_024997 [Carnegiea gigantea]|uniref:Uncharacterized protein n=1 Tax=Carnegiea gigantea TaxID=171969 RepID=A0A9Q1JRC5_9CARY|nr:hypothetical protein Cgig2_024997 [Carnegiea gigantea]
MNYKQGVRFCVAFTNYNQPIRKGRYIFLRFIGYIARLERFCPIGMIIQHKLNKMYKAHIIEVVQSKFMYPADKSFDKCVLKYVAKHFKHYEYGLKRDYFKPEEKTREDMYEIVPKGHSHDGWMRLVDYWCSKQHEVETHGREPTHLEFFKDTHSEEGGGFVANMATEDQSDIFGVNAVLRKRGYTFSNNNIELKRVRITEGHVPEESSGNDLSNETSHAGPSTSTSQVN